MKNCIVTQAGKTRQIRIFWSKYCYI